MPQTPIPGRGYGAPPQIPPLGAPALRAYRASLGAFGPSIVPQPQILDAPLGAHTL